MELIPAIDLIQGACVRLRQGDFAAATHYRRSPQQQLRQYAGLGARWVHVVDLDGARAGVRANHALIATLATTGSQRLQVGGGVRSTAAVELLLESGVARVVVGSVAAEDPQQVCGWLERFGPERLCLAFDVRADASGVPQVRTRGWAQAANLTLWEALERFPPGALRHVLCTDTARDGLMAGANLALYAQAVRRFPGIHWQASGGVRDAADLHALAATGVAAAVCGKALLEERIATPELRPFLPDASSPASTSATAG